MFSSLNFARCFSLLALAGLSQLGCSGRPLGRDSGTGGPDQGETAGRFIALPRDWKVLKGANGKVSFYAPDEMQGLTVVPFRVEKLGALYCLSHFYKNETAKSHTARLVEVERDPGDSVARATFEANTTSGTPMREMLTTWVDGSRGVLSIAFSVGKRPVPELAHPTGVGSAGTAKTNVRFHQVTATDGSFTLRLPEAWQVAYASQSQGLNAWSPAGEKVFSVILDVPESAQTVRTMSPYIPSEQAQVLAAIASPRLSPSATVEQLLPRAGAGLYQSMKILDTKPVTISGAESALIHYSYTMMPQQGSPFMRAGVPPPLRSAQTVPMEASTLIISLPGAPGFWTLMVIGIEAPAPVFDSHTGVYGQIAQSWQINGAAASEQIIRQSQTLGAINDTLKGVYASRNRAFNDLQKSVWAGGIGLSLVLGGETPGYSPSEGQVYPVPDDPKSVDLLDMYHWPRDMMHATMPEIASTLHDPITVPP